MDRAKFFASLRRGGSGVFGSSLSQAQVQGCEAILDACARYGVTDQHHVAECLAEPYHETGGYMLPIKETVMPSHKDKNPPDDLVIRRLDQAYAAGKLPWVSRPYWRKDTSGKAWFGRGPIQATHRINYAKIGQVLGVDLLKDPDRILEPAIGAASAVVGLRDGLYTGRKLSDFDFVKELAKATQPGGEYGPRRMVNGKDGTDRKVAGYHRAFYAALEAAGYDGKAPATPAAPKPANPVPAPPVAETKTYIPASDFDTIAREKMAEISIKRAENKSGKWSVSPTTIEYNTKGLTKSGWITALLNAILAIFKGNRNAS
ncbi:MAG: glycoside hydrolase family 19 protein [Rhizobiaceae bacterium]|nr:glycoside hydrolase family 19 protein [Desulfitobacteriaceae bacterium]MDI6838547.1 glycoside hydrolase family 19 protein [Rhizobiaceae bacterium]